MRRTILLLLGMGLLLTATPKVSCPVHAGSTCWFNGKIAPGTGAKQYSCSCGDKVWAK